MQLKNIHTIYIPTSSFNAFYFQKKIVSTRHLNCVITFGRKEKKGTET